jgi:SAM-dependent MidA family methyltransferase
MNRTRTPKQPKTKQKRSKLTKPQHTLTKTTTLHPTTQSSLHTSSRTKSKPLTTQTKPFSSNQHEDDDNDFEFDELPTLKPTTRRPPAGSTPQQAQPLKSTASTSPNAFIKPDGITAQVLENQEVSGTGTIGITAGGSVTRKLAQQPNLSHINEAELTLLDGTPMTYSDERIIGIDPKFQAMLDRKTTLTPLSNELRQQIVIRGPLSMAEYMQFCLGHPQHGYYMQRNAIGKKGDFVTSPEISPLFSEMIGIWGVSTWMRMGRPDKIQIVELGPGRGTLMRDFIATAERFPEFYNALSIHFVENSGAMRKLQRHALGVDLDLEFMKYHPSNFETNLALHDVVDGAGDPIGHVDNDGHDGNGGSDGHDQKLNPKKKPILRDGMTSEEHQTQQEGLLDNMHDLIEQSSSLRAELAEHMARIKQENGIVDMETLNQISLDALPSDLIKRIKQLEGSFQTEVDKANDLMGLKNDITFEKQRNAKSPPDDKTTNQVDFLNSFMRLSTGQFTPTDFSKLFLSQDSQSGGQFTHTQENPDGDGLDSEAGWVWNDKPSPVVQKRLTSLYEKEQSLQGQLSMLLPKLSIPSYATTPEQQAPLIEQYNNKVTKLLENDPVLAGKIELIEQYLEETMNEISELKESMYEHKIYNRSAHKYNKYMTSPVVVGTSNTKFDISRSTTLEGALPHGSKTPPPNSLDSFDLNATATETVKRIKTQLDKLKKDLPVSWHWTLLDVPSTAPCIILAHEFFDALPVHQFQFTQRGWREILVDADESFDGPHHFKYVLSPTPTPASVSFLQPSLLQPDMVNTVDGGNTDALFQFTEGHQHTSVDSKVSRASSQALQTAGSSQQELISRAVKLAQDQALIDDKMNPDKNASSGLILGLDGLPINKKAPKKTIANEITAKSLTESLSSLSNPMVSPDDVKAVLDITDASGIIGLDNKKLSKATAASPQEEYEIQSLDARFKRNRATDTGIDQDRYHTTHGIDNQFEMDEKIRHDTNLGSLQNSPKIRQKISSGNKVGDTYETSPASLMWAEQIALRLMKNGGAALMIDYGDNDLGHLTPADYQNASVNAYGVNTVNGHAFRHLSLQGIKQHQHADVLQEPGLVDLSAHVNFAALGAAMKKTEQLTNLLLSRPIGTPDHTRALEMLKMAPKSQNNPSAAVQPDLDPLEFTPRKLNITRAITQGALLQQLGLEDRFERLLKNAKTEPERMALYESINRLVDPDQMGELFKAMTVYTDMTRPPVGWDEDVTRREFQAHAHYDEIQREKLVKQEADELAQAERDYHERTKYINKTTRESNTYKMKQEQELEDRLNRAIESSKGANSTLLTGINDLNQFQPLYSSPSDAQAALDKLKGDREKEINKGFYTIDRSKYGAD